MNPDRTALAAALAAFLLLSATTESSARYDENPREVENEKPEEEIVSAGKDDTSMLPPVCVSGGC